MKKLLIFCVAVGFVFAISGMAQADTHYVDPFGSNVSPYTTPGTAAHSIQDAIGAATGGDTILVADGTYTITGIISVNKGVTITGNIANPEKVIVKYTPASNTLNCVEVNSADVTIQGIKVQDCKNGFYFNRDVSTHTDVTISNCIIESVSGWGIGEISSPNTVISHNTITNTGDKGIYIRKCEGTSESDRCEVISNVISGCGQPAIQVYKSPYTVVSGNTISSTSDKGIFIWGPNANSVTERVEVTNNIISGCPWTAILVIYDRYTYIHGNNVGPTGDKGIAIGDGQNINNVNERIEVSGNTITGTKWPGIQVAYSVPYTYIYGNTLTGCNYYGGDGTGDWDYASIHVDENCPNTVIDSNTVSDGINGIQIWSDNCEVTNNEIYDMCVTYENEKNVDSRTYKNSGILVGSNWGSDDIDPTGTVIQCNNIYDNYWGLFYSADLSNGVDATQNWWGDCSGPYNSTTNPLGTGNAVSDNVYYDPWSFTPDPCEAKTMGFWKNHEDSVEAVLSLFTDNKIPLGDYTVTNYAEAKDVFKNAKNKNANTMLAAQLLAAKLNVAHLGHLGIDYDCDCIDDVIDDADAFLTSQGYSGPDNPGDVPKGLDKEEANEYKDYLDDFNQGECTCEP
jgi:parallel beta-helix repeat protein